MSDIKLQVFSVIVTLLGLEKIVTIISIKLPFWSPLWFTKNCHNKQLVALSGVTIIEYTCTVETAYKVTGYKVKSLIK